MGLTSEIYLTKKFISKEEWLELINTISNYNGFLRKWKIIITNDRNQIRYFVKTRCSLPATINNLNSFLLKPTKEIKATKQNYTLLFLPKVGSSIIDLINYSEIRNKGTLEYLEISFLKLYEDKIKSKIRFYLNKNGVTKKYNVIFAIPTSILSADFEGNKRYFYKSSPKYLEINKILHLLITELGYNLGGLATGLGISSVVIALAAQDIAKSFLAGISIISDRPFEIGDYITVGDLSGTVEDITFRTTRIRNADDQVIVLPNSVLTDNNIINSSKRDCRRFRIVLTLELDTPLEKVTQLTENIKLALTTHPQVINETVKVFFETISADGIDLSIDLKTSALEYVDYLKFKEEINYTLLDMVNQAKIGLAYPSQSIYLKKD